MHECEYSYYLQEILEALAERVTEMQRSERVLNPSPFEDGRALAYYEVTSILENRASTMQIDLTKLGLKYAADDLLNPDSRERGTNSRPNA